MARRPQVPRMQRRQTQQGSKPVNYSSKFPARKPPCQRGAPHYHGPGGTNRVLTMQSLIRRSQLHRIGADQHGRPLIGREARPGVHSREPRQKKKAPWWGRAMEYEKFSLAAKFVQLLPALRLQDSMEDVPGRLSSVGSGGDGLRGGGDTMGTS